MENDTLFLLAGCSDDPSAAIEMATIIIDPTPDDAVVQWRLDGTSHAEGFGYRRVEVYSGDYTLRWAESEDWVNTGSGTVSFRVNPGDSYVIEGSFFRDAPAHVIVDVEPDDLNQAWTVTTSDGQVVTGTGDFEFPVDHSGSVSVQWGEQDGWWWPFPYTATQVALGDTVTFTGTYQEVLEDPEGESVCLPSGAFLMGSPGSEWGRERDELQHEVVLSNRFWIPKYELDTWSFLEGAVQATLNGAAYLEIVTSIQHSQTFTDTLYYDNNDNIAVIAHYSNTAPAQTLVNSIFVYDRLGGSDALLTEVNPEQVVVNSNPNVGNDPLVPVGTDVYLPISGITWYGSAAYCDWLNVENGYPLSYSHATWAIEGGDPYAVIGYRLPTEAEWEYACRGGTTTAFSSGPIISLGVDIGLSEVAWYGGDGRARMSGLKPSNFFGLFDMHGNLFEWCNDYYEYYAYSTSDRVDPSGPVSGTTRCKRGGDVVSSAAQCRSANRSAYYPNQRSLIGLRPVKLHAD